MPLDIPLYRKNKGQKSMPFFDPNIWNKLSSKNENGCNYKFLNAHFEKMNS